MEVEVQKLSTSYAQLPYKKDQSSGIVLMKKQLVASTNCSDDFLTRILSQIPIFAPVYFKLGMIIREQWQHFIS